MAVCDHSSAPTNDQQAPHFSSQPMDPVAPPPVQDRQSNEVAGLNSAHVAVGEEQPGNPPPNANESSTTTVINDRNEMPAGALEPVNRLEVTTEGGEGPQIGGTGGEGTTPAPLPAHGDPTKLLRAARASGRDGKPRNIYNLVPVGELVSEAYFPGEEVEDDDDASAGVKADISRGGDDVDMLEAGDDPPILEEPNLPDDGSHSVPPNSDDDTTNNSNEDASNDVAPAPDHKSETVTGFSPITDTFEHVANAPCTSGIGDARPLAVGEDSSVAEATQSKRRHHRTTTGRIEREIRGAGNWRAYLVWGEHADSIWVEGLRESVGWAGEWILDVMDVLLSRVPASALHALCYYQPLQGHLYRLQTTPIIPFFHHLRNPADVPAPIVWLWDTVADAVSQVWRRNQFRVCAQVPREAVCQMSSLAVVRPLMGSGARLVRNAPSFHEALVKRTHESGTSAAELWLDVAAHINAPEPPSPIYHSTIPDGTPSARHIGAVLGRLYSESEAALHAPPFWKSILLAPFSKFVAFDIVPFVNHTVLHSVLVGALLAATASNNTNGQPMLEDASAAEGVAAVTWQLLSGLDGVEPNVTLGTFLPGANLSHAPRVLGGAYRIGPRLFDSSTLSPQPNISRLCAATKLFTNTTAIPGAVGGMSEMEAFFRPGFLLVQAIGGTLVHFVAWVVSLVLWAGVWAPFGVLPAGHYVYLKHFAKCVPFRASLFASPIALAITSPSSSSNTTLDNVDALVELAPTDLWVGLVSRAASGVWSEMGLGPLQVWSCNWDLAHEISTDHSVIEFFEELPLTIALWAVVGVLFCLCALVMFRYRSYFRTIHSLRERELKRLADWEVYEASLREWNERSSGSTSPEAPSARVSPSRSSELPPLTAGRRESPAGQTIHRSNHLSRYGGPTAAVAKQFTPPPSRERADPLSAELATGNAPRSSPAPQHHDDYVMPPRSPARTTTTTSSKSPKGKSATKKRPSKVHASTLGSSACSCFEICQFPEPPIGDYRCPLDGGVLRDAVRSRRCMHTFGMQCILTHLLKVEERCPVCRVPMECGDLEPAERIRNEIMALPFRCRELDRCEWVGMVCEEADHANGSDCGVHLVLCPFCDRRLRAGEEFDLHKEVCPEAIVICPDCFEDMPRKEIPMHKAGLGGRKCQISEPMRQQQAADRRRAAEEEAARREARVLEAHREREEQRAKERAERKRRHEEDPNYLSFYSQHPNISVYQSSVLLNSPRPDDEASSSVARSTTRNLDSELRGASLDRPSICHEEDDHPMPFDEDYLPSPAPVLRSRVLTPRSKRNKVEESIRSSGGKGVLLSPIVRGPHPVSASSGLRGSRLGVDAATKPSSAPVEGVGARRGNNPRPLSPTTIVQEAQYDSYFDGPREEECDAHFHSGTSGFSPVAPEGSALAHIASVLDEVLRDRERDRDAIEVLKATIASLETKHAELELRHYKLQSTVSEVVDVIAAQAAPAGAKASVEVPPAATARNDSRPSSATKPSLGQHPSTRATSKPPTPKRQPSPPTSAPPAQSSRLDSKAASEESTAPVETLPTDDSSSCVSIPTKVLHAPPPLVPSSQQPAPAVARKSIPRSAFTVSTPTKRDKAEGEIVNNSTSRPSSRPSSQIVQTERKGSAASSHQAALDFVFSGMKKPASTPRDGPPAPPPATSSGIGAPPTPTSTTSSNGRRSAANGKESANPRIRKAALSAATPEREPPAVPTSVTPKRAELKYTHKVNVAASRTPLAKVKV